MHDPSRSRFAKVSPLCVSFLPLLLLAWVLTGLSPDRAWAQFEGDTITSVTVEGLVSYAPRQILANLKTKVGQPYRPLDVREDLQSLARIMRTASISVEPVAGGQVVVRFRVTEFPRLHALQIVGNIKLKTERIETLLKLKAGETVLDAQTVESARRALEREYQALGMPQTQVRLNLIDVPPPAEPGKSATPPADLQIVIDEGEQILCQDVILRGNKAFSTVRLKMLVKTNGTWLFVKNYYGDQVFDEDLDRLREFYAAHGYFDARVQRGAFQVARKGDKSVVSPVIEIEEGRRYTVGEIEIRGGRLYSQGELRGPFEPLKGKPFDGQAFATALDRVQSLYLDHGLLTTELKPEYSYDAEHHRLNMLLQVTERNRIYLGRIQLDRPTYKEEEKTGWFRSWYERVAPPVKDEAIVRELLLEPGDIYNRRLERDSLRRLARMGVFDEQTLRLHDAPTQDPGIHDMVVEVQETVTGALSGGIGFGDASGAFIYASLNEKNVGGEANVFSLGANLGTRLSSISASYLDRHIGDSRDSLASRLYYEIQTRPGYVAGVGGAQMEWGHPLAGDWMRYLRGRLEYVRLDERESIDTLENLNRAYPVATLRLRFEEDTREPFGGPPKRGYLQSYGVEAGYAGGPLLQLEAMRDQYRPLGERLTWRLYAMAGLMPNSAGVVPIHERYFLGGNTDMRGFAYRGAGYFDKKEDSIPIGGAAKILLKNELIFPIYSPISGVVFADVGDLGRTPFSWQVPRVSTGVGLRFDMQRVRVGLDLALPVVSQGDDQTRFFHFSLESNF